MGRPHGAARAMQAGQQDGRSPGPRGQSSEARASGRSGGREGEGGVWAGSRPSSRSAGGTELGPFHARSCRAEGSCPWRVGASARVGQCRRKGWTDPPPLQR